jgi:ribosomal protein L7/L12
VGSTIWNDEPSSIDGLDRSNMAKAIHNVITQCDTPLVIGLYGTWGIGKTSLMKLVELELERSGEVVTVWFDAWQHQFDENPAVALLHTMVDDLRLGEEGRRLLFAIASALGEIALKRTAGVSTKDLQQLQEQYEEQRFAIREKQIRLRKYFEELLQRASGNGSVRIVFFIDDLDRCLPENILSVLEALKLFLNMPGCVYVLGVDRQALEASIRRKYPDSPAVNEAEYLDKIVQLPFIIPNVPPRAAKTYIESLLPADLQAAAKLLVDGIGQNPRQIKRFVNSLVLNSQLALVGDSAALDARILAAVLLIQLRNIDAYKELTLNPDLLKEPKKEWLSDPAVGSAFNIIVSGTAEAASIARRYLNISEAAAVRNVTYDVLLTDSGATKIQVIKAVRTHTSLGLKESKDLVDAAPTTVGLGLDRGKADAFVQDLIAAGAKAEVA